MAGLDESDDRRMLVERMKSQSQHRRVWRQRFDAVAVTAAVAGGDFDAAYDRLCEAEAAWYAVADEHTAEALWTARAGLAVPEPERPALLARALGPPLAGGKAAFARQAAWARLMGVSEAVVARHSAFYDELIEAAQQKAAGAGGTSERAEKRRHVMAGVLAHAMRAQVNKMREGLEPPRSSGGAVFGWLYALLNVRDPDDHADDFVDIVERQGEGTVRRRGRREETVGEFPDRSIEGPALPVPAEAEARAAIALALDHLVLGSPERVAPATLIGRTKVDPVVVVEAARIWVRHETVLRDRAQAHGRSGPGREALRLAEPVTYARGGTAANKRVEKVLPAVAWTVVAAVDAAQDLADSEDLLKVLRYLKDYFSLALLEALGPFLRAEHASEQHAAGLDLGADALASVLDLADQVGRPPGDTKWAAQRWVDFREAVRRLRQTAKVELDSRLAEALTSFEAQLARLERWVVTTYAAYLVGVLTSENADRVGEESRLAMRVSTTLEDGSTERAPFIHDIAHAARAVESHAAALQREDH